MQLLYAMLNAREDTVCERVFMEKRGCPFSLESRQPLSRFDVIAFSLQYEGDYVNALSMLRDASIPLRRVGRDGGAPVLIAGGPAVTANPTVLSEFFDLFIIGEWEPISERVVDCLKEATSGKEQLGSLRDVRGVYLPDLDQSVIQRSWAKDLDECPHPTAQVIPKLEKGDAMSPIFGICFSLEAVRSCNRGCRFCLASWIGRPMREHSLRKLDEVLEDARRYTPVSKVSLIGAGISDHSRLKEIPSLVSSKGFQMSIPSLHIESIDNELAREIVEGGQRTVSLAPEAGTPELRSIIGKSLDDDRLLEVSEILHDSGVSRLKLYFMIGLPGEEEKDIASIPSLANRLLRIGFSEVALSVNPFIPKPHTPFQRESFAGLDYLRRGFKIISSSTRNGRIRVEGIDPRDAQIQALLSLGDSEIGKVVELVSLYGSGLGAWRRAYRELGRSPQEILASRSSRTDVLPWDFLDMHAM